MKGPFVQVEDFDAWTQDIIDSPESVYYLEIHGQAFLWHQIRCIAEVVFMVGRGQEQPGVMQELLNVEKYPVKPSYPLADEKPLVLQGCLYDNLRLSYSAQNIWTVRRMPHASNDLWRCGQSFNNTCACTSSARMAWWPCCTWDMLLYPLALP